MKAHGYCVYMCRQKKGTLLSKKGAGVAFLHEGYPITDGDSCTYATVRHVSCELIVTSGDRCASCHSYRPTLQASVWFWTPERYS